jgi:hypothetical protein
MKDQNGTVNGFRRVSQPIVGMSIQAHSPVDLEVTDPVGNTINKDTTIITEEEVLHEVPGTLYYTIWGIDTDGNPNPRVSVPTVIAGNYTIKVFPKPGVRPDATYSLDVTIQGVTSNLVLDARVSDIPAGGGVYYASDPSALGARGVKSNILAELVVLRGTATTRFDCWELDEAIEDMIDALGLDDPAAPRWVHDAHRAPNCRGHHHHPRVPLWLDETHVNPDAAWWVFSNEKDAVKELLEIVKARKSKIPDATAQALIDRIVKCDRLLGVVSIQDATNAGAKQKRLNQAQKEVTQGDQDAAAGRPAQAIEHYWRAWFFASYAGPDFVRALDQ